MEALRSVIDPELHKDIVTLEMVRSIDVHPNGVVDVTVSLTTPGCPIRDHFQTSVEEARSAGSTASPASTSPSTMLSDSGEASRFERARARTRCPTARSPRWRT